MMTLMSWKQEEQQLSTPALGTTTYSVLAGQLGGLCRAEQAGLLRIWSSRDNTMLKRIRDAWEGIAARIFQKARGHVLKVQQALLHNAG